MSNPLAKLVEYKQAIDADIAAYSQHVRKHTAEHFGQYVLEAEVAVFLDILGRGGKRIRGALVMAGYEMCGGQDRAMITQAARAIEMLHAYILMVDDIQDRSDLRRGKPSAHKMLEAYHKKHKLKGDAEYAGLSLAIGAALSGAHAAEAIVANMDADPQLKLNALSIINRTMAITAHGQTLDIMNELVAEPSEQDIERVLEWKTALYTVINPLHVGMVLAGADCKVTDAITPYGLHAGKAFQITDDILGVYGDEAETGKTPGDDIREGKGTLLVRYALEHASAADQARLRECLGNPKLTAKDFAEARRIIQSSGALEHAKQEAAHHLDQALKALEEAKGHWAESGTDFLRALSLALLNRVA